MPADQISCARGVPLLPYGSDHRQLAGSFVTRRGDEGGGEGTLRIARAAAGHSPVNDSDRKFSFDRVDVTEEQDRRRTRADAGDRIARTVRSRVQAEPLRKSEEDLDRIRFLSRRTVGLHDVAEDPDLIHGRGPGPLRRGRWTIVRP